MTRDDVLIIGAGPSGLFAAVELERHGVKARLIEREVRTHREARATAIQPGTLAVLDRHLASYLVPDATVDPVH